MLLLRKGDKQERTVSSMRLLCLMLLFLGMGVAVSFAMRLVHAFVQHLGFLPRVFVTGHGCEDERGGAKNERSCFHEG